MVAGKSLTYDGSGHPAIESGEIELSIQVSNTSVSPMNSSHPHSQGWFGLSTVGSIGN